MCKLCYRNLFSLQIKTVKFENNELLDGISSKIIQNGRTIISRKMRCIEINRRQKLQLSKDCVRASVTCTCISYEIVCVLARTSGNASLTVACDTFNRDICGRTVSTLLHEERKQDKKGVMAWANLIN